MNPESQIECKGEGSGFDVYQQALLPPSFCTLEDFGVGERAFCPPIEKFHPGGGMTRPEEE